MHKLLGCKVFCVFLWLFYTISMCVRVEWGCITNRNRLNVLLKQVNGQIRETKHCIKPVTSPKWLCLVSCDSFRRTVGEKGKTILRWLVCNTPTFHSVHVLYHFIVIVHCFYPMSLLSSSTAPTGLLSPSAAAWRDFCLLTAYLMFNALWFPPRLLQGAEQE